MFGQRLRDQPPPQSHTGSVKALIIFYLYSGDCEIRITFPYLHSKVDSERRHPPPAESFCGRPRTRGSPLAISITMTKINIRAGGPSSISVKIFDCPSECQLSSKQFLCWIPGKETLWTIGY